MTESPKEEQKKPRRLSMKQKRFIREYVSTGNGTQSVINAGYDVKNDKVASVISSENLEKPSIQHGIQALCDKHGLSDELIMETMRNNITDARVLRLACELKGYVGNNAKVYINNQLSNSQEGQSFLDMLRER